jgi:hypothetical protein
VNKLQFKSNLRVQVFDLEVFPNFFFALFYDLDSNEYIEFRIDDLASLKKHLEKDLTLVGFNSKHYDSVILRCVAEGRIATCAEIYQLSTDIIGNSLVKPIASYKWKINRWNDVDLMNIHPAYGKEWSLKKHQVRLKWSDVRDLPYPFDTPLTNNQQNEVEVYCKNDVDSTNALYEDFNEEGILDTCVKVANEYDFIGNEAFFLSQAQIGTRVMKHLYRVAAGISMYDKVYKPKSQLFDPSSAIDAKVSFTNQANTDALVHLRSLPRGNVIDIVASNRSNKGPRHWAKSNLSDLRFQAGDLSIPLGVGGLHSDRNQGAHRGNIVDFDVTSYYPNIIKMLNRSPQGLTSDWMSEYMKPFNKRLQLKAEGDKVGADAMKIVINAVYGQLNYPLSDSFDPALQMAVTINGQLFLLMLAERFAEADFLIISANTDGITIDVGDREKDAVRIANQWSEDTGFNLERDSYDLYVSQNVNNYFACNSKTNKLKCKGWFKTTNRLTPIIVVDAVIARYVHGTDVTDSINNADNLFDFLIVGTSKAKQVSWRGEELQKTNRWYKAVNGAPITFVNGDKRGKIPNSDNAVPVNKLDDATIPANLDRQYYVDEALKVIRNIAAGIQSTRSDTNELIYTATKLEQFGLTVQPKGRLDNPKANLPGPIPTEKTDVSLDDFPWYMYNGVGVVTGKAFNTIAIDVDHLPEARESGLFKFTQKSVAHICSYHGNATVKEVRGGEHRGTLIFQYDGDEIQSTGSQFLKKYGFEILYGNKVVQLRGVHDTGEPYSYGGTIKPLPPRLLKFLKTVQGTIAESPTPYKPDPIRAAVKKYNKKSARSSVDAILKKVKDHDVIKHLEAFAAVANQDEDYKSIGGELHLKERNDRPRLEGFCPVLDHADDRGEPFSVTFVNDTFYCNCFHTECADGRAPWLESIVSKVDVQSEPPLRRITELSVRAPEGIEEKSILDALKMPDRFKLITAGTGAGKTYGSARLVAEQLANWDSQFVEDESNSALPIKVLHLVPSKDAMIQVMTEYQGALGDDPREFGIDMIDATGTMKVGEVISRKKPRKNTRVVITHFTYFGRKGDSWHHYGIAGWVDGDTDVIIDEVDSFFESQTYRVPLGWRGKRRTVQGKITYLGVNQCPASSGSGNCASCRMSKYNGHTYIANNHNNLEYRYRPYLEEELLNTKKLQNNHVEFEHLVQETVLLNETTEVKLLAECADSNTRDIRFEREDIQMGEFHEWVIDLINTSFAPTAWRSFINGPNGEMSTDEGKDLFFDPRTGKVDSEAAREAKVVFPRKICNQVTLAMIDKITFNLFATAKSLTVLTATLPRRKREILDHVYEGLVKAEDRKIDKLIIIGTSRQFGTRTINRFIGRGPKSFGKMLVFKPTKKKALALWENIRRDSNHNIVLARDKNASLQADGTTINNIDADIVVSHSFGSLGRGMNLGEFSTMFIDSAIYKPAIAYNITDVDELNLVQQEERAAAIVQNSGRFLRLTDNDDGFRMLIVSGLHGESEIEVLKSAIQPMVKDEINSLWWNRKSEDEPELVELLAQVYEMRGVFEGDSNTVEAVTTIGHQQSARFSKQTQKWLKKIRTLRDSRNLKWGRIKSDMNYSKLNVDQRAWFDTIGKAEYDSKTTITVEKSKTA